MKQFELEEYDAGYLPDNPDQDYVRYILACAHDFYQQQLPQIEDEVNNEKYHMVTADKIIDNELKRTEGNSDE